MTNKNNLPSAEISDRKLINSLNEAAGYYHSFLKPALAEGFSALVNDQKLLLTQIYFQESPPEEDERLLAEYLGCQVPEARMIKQKTLDTLAFIISDQTGILLSRQLLLKTLQTAAIEEHCSRLLEQNNNLSISEQLAAEVSILFHFVLTAQFLATRATRLFGDRIYQVNYIKTETPGNRLEERDLIDQPESKQAPDGIELKSINISDINVTLLIDERKQIYILIEFPGLIPDNLCLQITSPSHRKMDVILDPSHSSDLSHQIWKSIGYIDTEGYVVLRSSGEDIRFDQVDEPISFSCIAK